MSDGHMLALVSMVHAGVLAWLVRGQQRQLEEMQRLLASRSFAEYGRVVRQMEAPPDLPKEEPQDGGYAAAFNSPHGHG